MRKTVTAAAMAASLTIGGAAGATLFVPATSGAQTDDTSDEPSDDVRHGGLLADALAPLVEDGTITRAQADAVIDALGEARPDDFPRHRHLPSLATLADALGTERDALIEALRDGQTIEDIAEDNGVPVDDVVAALVGEAQEHLDRAVANGRLSPEVAESKAAELTERITAMVNGDVRRGFRPGRHGPFGDATGS